MPVRRRRGIDRATCISPAGELIDSDVGAKPSVIEDSADGFDAGSWCIVVNSITTIGITDITYIALCGEIATETTLSESDTHGEGRVYALADARLYPHRQVLKTRRSIFQKEILLSFTLGSTSYIEKAYLFLKRTYIGRLFCFLEIVDVFPAVPLWYTVCFESRRIQILKRISQFLIDIELDMEIISSIGVSMLTGLPYDISFFYL